MSDNADTGLENKKEGMSTNSKVLLGCGAGCLIVLLAVGGVAVYIGFKGVDMVNSLLSAITQEFERQGFKKFKEGEITIDNFEDLQKDVTISQPVSEKTLYWGKQLTVNAPCEKDIAFFGNFVIINSEIKGNFIYLGNGSVLVSKGAKVAKIYINPQATVTINGEVPGGVSTDINEVIDGKDIEKAMENTFDFLK